MPICYLGGTVPLALCGPRRSIAIAHYGRPVYPAPPSPAARPAQHAVVARMGELHDERRNDGAEVVLRRLRARALRDLHDLAEHAEPLAPERSRAVGRQALEDRDLALDLGEVVGGERARRDE